MEANPPGHAASRTLLDYLQLVSECERIAIRIHPSYQRLFADVPAMMALPPGFANATYDVLYILMTQKKKTFEEMESKLRNNLSGGLPIATAAAGRDVSAFPLSAKGPKRAAGKTENEGPSKKGKRAPLQTQVEELELSIDAIRAGIADSLDEVRTLPINWAHRA